MTGAGAISPLGPDLDSAWDRCLRGDSGIGESHRFRREGPAGRVTGEVPPLDLSGSLRLSKNEKFMGPSVRYLMHAALSALASSGLDLDAIDPYRIAVYTASGQTGLEGSDLFPAFELAWTGDEERDFANLGGRPSRLIDRYFSLRTLANAGLGLLSAEIGAQGPSNNYIQGDTAAALALTSGRHDLLEDRADVAIVAAYDSLLNISSYLAYESAGLLSRSEASRAHRPFDRDRDGIVLGEGAAAVVLERREDASRRRAPLVGQLVSVGATMEVEDAVEAKTSDRAIRSAIDQIGIDDIDLVVAHGIGTIEGDRREAGFLTSLVGTSAPVSAFKGLTGYLGAASSLLEYVLTLESLRRRCAPPIARHDVPDQDCRLDLVAHHPRPLTAAVPTALCLSWSWLGQCAALRLEAPINGGSRQPGEHLTEEEVLDRLRSLARDELEMRPEELARLDLESPLVDGLQLDSLRQVVLLTAVEGAFGVELGYDDAERLQSLRTLGDLVRLLRERAEVGP